MEKYNQVLNLFTGYDELRPHFSKPMLVDNMAIATNTHTMVFFDKELCDESLLTPAENQQRILAAIPLNRHMDIGTVTVEELKAALNMCPLIDEMKIIQEESKCEACYGHGDVDFEFNYGRKTYELEGDCPVCEGTGGLCKEIKTPTGGKIADNKKYLRINGAAFSNVYIEQLIKACEILGTEEIKVTRIAIGSACVFQTGDIEIIIMPVHAEEKDIYETIIPSTSLTQTA